MAARKMGAMLSALVCATGLGMWLQTAVVDITPPELLPLGGFTARKGKIADPGGQPLYARALVLGDWTLVAVDMLTVPEAFYKAVEKRTGAKNLWIVATHTHCAPDSQMLNPKMTFAIPGITGYSPRWFNWYVDHVASAVEMARGSQKVEVSKLTLVRTRVKLNHGRRPDAKADETAWLLAADGKPVLASYAAHATFHDENWNKTDGDWPGLLATKTGAVVVPGAIGDVAPEATGTGPVEKCSDFVEKFRLAVAKGRVMGVWNADRVFDAEQVSVPLGAPVPHPTFAKTYGVPDSFAQVLVTGFAQQSCYVQTVHFGKFLMVGIPGEPSADLGRKIQAEARRAGFPHCLVVSHVDGWIGYILEPQDYDRGGYEATLSFNGRDTADRILKAASKILGPKPQR